MSSWRAGRRLRLLFLLIYVYTVGPAPVYAVTDRRAILLIRRPGRGLLLLAPGGPRPPPLAAAAPTARATSSSAWSSTGPPMTGGRGPHGLAARYWRRPGTACPTSPRRNGTWRRSRSRGRAVPRTDGASLGGSSHGQRGGSDAALHLARRRAGGRQLQLRRRPAHAARPRHPYPRRTRRAGHVLRLAAQRAPARGGVAPRGRSRTRDRQPHPPPPLQRQLPLVARARPGGLLPRPHGGRAAGRQRGHRGDVRRASADLRLPVRADVRRTRRGAGQLHPAGGPPLHRRPPRLRRDEQRSASTATWPGRPAATWTAPTSTTRWAWCGRPRPRGDG